LPVNLQSAEALASKRRRSAHAASGLAGNLWSLLRAQGPSASFVVEIVGAG
jgi:hypothetical protein